MDDNKDIQKTDSISRFIDGHAVRTNPFGENRAGDRAYRRAERISAAVHLLTNHIDSKEPVCAAIRAGAVELLRRMMELRSEMRSAQSSGFTAAQAQIRHLISLVRILAVSGYVSMQNASTMVEALDELGNFMTAAQRSMLSESIAISREDLLDVRMPTTQKSARTLKDIKDTSGSDVLGTVTNVAEASVIDSSNVGQLSVRSLSILETLQNGGLMGIKDICSNHPEYSEKMIQRELAEMVEAGKVRKTGLKRWSRYVIA
jgi:phage tail sheath protein FI